jgi:hypothetical protein
LNANLLFRRFENFTRKPSEIPIRDANLGALAETHGEEWEKSD